MAKMVDARDLKSLGQSRPGSIPGERTTAFSTFSKCTCGGIGPFICGYCSSKSWTDELAKKLGLKVPTVSSRRKG